MLLYCDEQLTAKDILTVECKADLIMLMGCLSGIGPALGGREGLKSLPRSFLASGAGYVIATLSHIDDKLATAILRETVSKTIRGVDSAKALAMSQKALEKTGQFNPLAISSFFIVGAWSAHSTEG